MSSLRELDEEIALLRGWRRLRDVSRDELADLDYDRAYPETIATHWLSDELAMEAAPPPFSSSWALAGPLFEEASEPGDGIIRCPWCRDEDGRWVAGPVAGVDEFGCGRGDGDITARGNERLHHGATPRLAAARRWVAWRRGRA